MRPDDMVREFFLGFIKVHILHHAAEARVYGFALIAELRRHGYELSPGKLYPVLHQLEEAGHLGRLNRVVNGKVRKYYVLTRRGGLRCEVRAGRLASSSGNCWRRTSRGRVPRPVAWRRDPAGAGASRGAPADGTACRRSGTAPRPAATPGAS